MCRRSLGHVAVFAAVISGLILAAAGPAQATFPGRNGLIAHGYSYCEATEASIGITGPSGLCDFIPTGTLTGACGR
jgi:hypothetical protein